MRLTNLRLIILLIISSNLNSSLLAQTSISITTPNGSIVPDTYMLPEFSSSQIASLNYQIAVTYPNASAQTSSSNTYNCHAYAWHITEGGSNVWLGYYTATAEDIYWNDESYIEICNDQVGAKVSYSSDNHSAITTNNLGIFKSKWGAFPVMEHASNYTPYNSSNLKYYIKKPSIQGPSQFCTTATYQIPNLPNGATVTWSATGSISISGSTTANPVSVSKSIDGTGT
ncbi:hypothetical protein [Pedobacter glucosidilyticus]|uniref:hypothetical protein n=1 Tax=Pedobacter glucosidilyticus TaxID=1122941 RepID=UPI0012DDF4C8|nr:hypothetical protein [Pedobacter glucosidilyticus]